MGVLNEKRCKGRVFALLFLKVDKKWIKKDLFNKLQTTKQQNNKLNKNHK